MERTAAPDAVADRVYRVLADMTRLEPDASVYFSIRAIRCRFARAENGNPSERDPDWFHGVLATLSDAGRVHYVRTQSRPPGAPAGARRWDIVAYRAVLDGV